MATLLLELALTRIFSAVFYYDFAFLAISIALFGLGVGGVLPAPKIGLTNWQLALIYFTTALPFLGAGTIVSLAVSETIERVNRIYFFDLLGAAGGCLLLVPMLNQFGGPGTVLAAAVLFAASGIVWFSMSASVAGRAISVAAALALVALQIVNVRNNIIGPRFRQSETFAKVAITVAMIASAGFAMGMPFPTGIAAPGQLAQAVAADAVDRRRAIPGCTGISA